MEVQIKYHVPDMEKIMKISVGDWIDLRAADDVFIPVCAYENVSLGISMKLPEGYEAHVLPRSSTFMRYGVIMVNGMGVIDESYSGDNDVWHFPAFCLMPNGRNGEFPGSWIRKNDRICQFRIMPKQPAALDFVEVFRMRDKDRGGFGSTGR